MQKSSKDLKLSLVPGYEDDSETEEDSPRKINLQQKPLFPIAESSTEDSEKLSKRIELTAGSVRIYEYKKKEANLEANEEHSTAASGVENEPKESKEDLDNKANKFLDNIEMPSKGFQRKKRIAFDGELKFL